MKKLLLVLLLLVPIGCFAADKNLQSLDARYTIHVYDSQKFITEIKDFVKMENGFIKYYSQERLIIRLPKDKINLLQAQLKNKCYVANENLFFQDYSSRLLEIESTLVTKQKLLKDLNLLLEKTNVEQTLALEKEVISVIENIEHLKGEKRYLIDRISNAYITIFINQKIIVLQNNENGSSFEWLQNLGIENFIESFNE